MLRIGRMHRIYSLAVRGCPTPTPAGGFAEPVVQTLRRTLPSMRTPTFKFLSEVSVASEEPVHTLSSTPAIRSPEAGYARVAVHCGHRFAASGIGNVQNGQAFVLGVAGLAYIRVIIRTTMNTDAATIRKTMMLLMNIP